MRSVAPMKTAKIGYIVMSALLCALGILLIVRPIFSVAFIGTVTGILLILFGLVKLVGYFSKDLFRLAFQYDLAFGVLLMVLGALVLIRPGRVMSAICIAIGISVLADGLFKVQIAIDAKTFGIGKWWAILLLALLAGVIGMVLIFRPSGSARVLTMLLGISLLCEGVLNFITVLLAVKIINHQQPDVIYMENISEEE